MPNKSGSLARNPFWIITCYRNNRIDALTIDSDGDGGSLAVFSFEEEAEMFLRLFEDDEKMEWCSRQTTAGELVSVLTAPCASVKQVVLDPLPLPFGRAALPFLSMSRERFVQNLIMERYRGTVGELVSV